jgi:hypothetical protein
MESKATTSSVGLDSLRQRNVSQHARSDLQAKEAVHGLNAEQMFSDKNMSDQKTFGRTPDGIGE